VFITSIRNGKLGTEYGGWIIPNYINLNENSIIYSAGVGEDISFDLLLSDKYKSNIYLIDLTQKAKKHYFEVINNYLQVIFKKIIMKKFKI